MAEMAAGTTEPTRWQEAGSFINTLANAYSTIRAATRPAPTAEPTNLLDWPRKGGLSEGITTALMIAGGVAVIVLVARILRR